MNEKSQRLKTNTRPTFAVFSIAMDSSKSVIKALFASKLGWSLPLLLALLLLAALLGLTTLIPALSPFVYPLF